MKRLLNTLYITTPDIFLALDGENIVLQKESNILGRVPLHNLESIVAFGFKATSPALMGKCAQSGIELVYLSMNGKFLARIQGETHGNVLLRRQQYRYADDASKSLEICRNMISAKLFNSRRSVERTRRDHPLRIDTNEFIHCSSLLKKSYERANKAPDKDTLRGIEGEGAQIYFSLFNQMILQQKEDFFFRTRSKRPPLDNVNALLSFSYALATSMCTSALEAVGLDAYVGFMHTDRPGRRSLALDLVEELRSPLCDRFVLSLINKKIITSSDLIQREDGSVILTEQGRKTFLSAWQSRKDDELVHPFLETKIKWGLLPYCQALLLARCIRGDLDTYPPFLWK